MGIGEPTADGYSVLWVVDVGGRRVIDDDGILQVSADLGQVFDVISLMVVAALTEESVVNNLVNVQLVQERVSILRIVSKSPDRSTNEARLTLETEAVKTTTS